VLADNTGLYPVLLGLAALPVGAALFALLLPATRSQVAEPVETTV